MFFLMISALSMREFPIFALLPSVVDRSFTARRFTTTRIPRWQLGRYKTCKARETLFLISLSPNFQRLISTKMTLEDRWAGPFLESTRLGSLLRTNEITTDHP